MSKTRRDRGDGHAASPAITALAGAIDFPVEAMALLTTALTHRSYANEHNLESNERLEFLGDAVLGLVVGDDLFHRFPGAPEGQLAKLRAGVVSMPMLAKQARSLGLGDCLLLGRGESLTGGAARESNLADAFEAVAGAFYLAGGLAPAAAFIMARLAGEIEAAGSGKGLADYKTLLQEELQGQGLRPRYEVTGEEGPDHGKEFTVAVYAGEKLLGRGSGRSKKEAEQVAACQALAHKIKANDEG